MRAEQPLRAPFPWFGGKRRVANVVWQAIGADVPNYVEPFFGSGAVLLARPGGPGKIETANDRDRYVTNFWRAIVADPWGVAAYCDWPVNEADLHARHKWLVNQHEFRERMHQDPGYYDVRVAGEWVWGLSQWIGAGWCVEPQNHKHPKLDGIGKGVHSERGHGNEADHRKRPDLDATREGRGVLAASARTRGSERHNEAGRPDLAGEGRGVTPRGRTRNLDAATKPQLSSEMGINSRGGGALHGSPRPNLNGGQGVFAASAYSPGRRPAIDDAGKGIHGPRLPSVGNDKGVHGVTVAPGSFLDALRALEVPEAPPCFEWFKLLALRLRRTRFICGDWQRVLGDSVLGKGKNVGGRRPCAVFLDPPYCDELRDPYLYAEDSGAISVQVRDWARDHGDDPDLRIALCGYFDEHAHRMPASWRAMRWKGSRGYAAADNDNREQETIWFSPHCQRPHSPQLQLFT